MKRQIFWYPVGPNQRKKVFISYGQCVGTFYELKCPKLHSVFRKTVLEFHRPSKFLCQTSGRQNHWSLVPAFFVNFFPSVILYLPLSVFLVFLVFLFLISLIHIRNLNLMDPIQTGQNWQQQKNFTLKLKIWMFLVDCHRLCMKYVYLLRYNPGCSCVTPRVDYWRLEGISFLPLSLFNRNFYRSPFPYLIPVLWICVRIRMDLHHYGYPDPNLHQIKIRTRISIKVMRIRSTV